MSLDGPTMVEFGRSSFNIDGSFEDNMFFTRQDLDDWLDLKGSAADGYQSLTKKILQYGGGEVDTSDSYAWLFHVPPTVTSYQDCFYSMVENQAFKEYVEVQGDE